ncbi:MAG: hypothetical protein HY877_04035, partial [Deltaproteobacteria bacterium]|nr:hypothetical protein [Deltaproteobacteria bacterium]
MSEIGTLITTGQFETLPALELAITQEAWGAETGEALVELGTLMVSAHADGAAVDTFFAQIQAYQESRQNPQAQRQLLAELARGISRYYAQIRPHLALRQLGVRRFSDPKKIGEFFLPHSARVDTNGARITDGAVFMMGAGAPARSTPPPPRRVRPEELKRQIAEARALYATFENLISEIPSGESLGIARQLVATLESQLRRESLKSEQSEREGEAPPALPVEGALPALIIVQAVQETYLQLLSLKLDAVFKATVDPKWVESFAREIEPKVADLLHDPHRGSIPEEVLRSLVQTYIRYWFGHFQGVTPLALTFLREVVYAAAHRVWKESASRLSLPSEAEGIFYREATELVYGLVTWESHRVAPLASVSTGAGAGYLSYADLVQKMGEYHAILEMLYGNLVGEGKIQAANGMMELVYKYVRLLSQRVGSKLNETYLKEHGLEADLVRLLLVRAENRDAYTEEALKALRSFFAIVTGRESPSLSELKDLPTLNPSARSSVVAQKVSYAPFEKGWTLADLIDHLPFRLGEAQTRADFESRVGLTYSTVRQWGKRKELGIAETPLDQDVAIEPEEHKKMWAVYLELDRMCQRYGMSLDFLDYLASIFPTVSEMRESAQKIADGQNEIVVRAPNIVKGIGFQFLNYGNFAAALRRSGFRGLLGEEVERPRWVTLARIAEYISNKAGGDETHQKEIYNFLVMLRLIDVMPMATDIRDVSGTVLSHRDPSIVSRYRLRIYPEDPAFQYSSGEQNGSELVSARRWPVSDVRSGKFDTKLEILEARAETIEQFLGLNYPLVTASGEATTVSALREKLQGIRKQHALYRGDLNDLSYDSPLRDEKAKNYLADLRKFYRGIDRLFHEWHLLVHARGLKQAGSLTIPYVIAPSVRGVTKSAQMENGFVAVVVDDLRGLHNQQTLFHLRIVIAKLRQEGVLTEKDLKDAQRIVTEVSPYFAESPADLMQAVQDNLKLTEILATQQLPVIEAELVQLLAVKTLPIGNGREPYYLYVPLWENDLRHFYNETERKTFAERDIEIAEDYFLAIRHPHYIHNGKRLGELVRKVYSEEAEAEKALDRLESFFTLIGVRTNAVAPNGTATGDIKIGELSELALRNYIDAFPSARGLNVPVPVVEAVLQEVVDRLLVQHPEARGHRTVLTRNLRRAVAEYNQAGDRISFSKLEETHAPLPLEGMLAERLQPYALDAMLRRAYFNLLPQLRHGTKPTIQTSSRLKSFVDYQWETMERFKNMVGDATIGVGNYVERKYGQHANLIDRVALARLVLFYLNNRILGFLPVALDEAIIDEVSRHFAPLQEVRELAIRSYRILLNNYLRELVQNLKEGDELILLSLDAIAKTSKAATKDAFLAEVAKDLQMTPELVAEGTKDYEAIAPLLGQKVARRFMPEAVDAAYALVQDRLKKEKADKKKKTEKEVRELEQRWEKSRAEIEAVLVLPVPVVPAFTPVDVTEWRGSQTRRDDYNRVLKKRKTDFDAIAHALDTEGRRLDGAKGAHTALKRGTDKLIPLFLSLDRTTNAEAVTKTTDEMGQKLEQRTAEVVAARASLAARRERVLADLGAMHESFKADAQAQPLLATASRMVDALSRQKILQKKIDDRDEVLVKEYEEIIILAEARSSTFENILEMGTRRRVFLKTHDEEKAREDTETESLNRENERFPDVDATLKTLRELAGRSVVHREALSSSVKNLEEASQAVSEGRDVKLQRRAALQLSINNLRERFETWVSRVTPRPFRAIPFMPEIPSAPYLIKNGTRQIFGIHVSDSAELKGRLHSARHGIEAWIDSNLTKRFFIFTAHGTFLIEDMYSEEVIRWIRSNERKTLKVRDILGEEIVLTADDVVLLQNNPAQFAAWEAAKKENPPQNIYVRFLENFRLLTKEGSDDIYVFV